MGTEYQPETTPLAGVRVLELSEGWSSGSLCGRMLGDLGATVTKVERPDGDGIHQIGPRHEAGDSYLATGVLLGKNVVCLEDVKDIPAQLIQMSGEADIILIDSWWYRYLDSVGMDLEECWRQEGSPLIVGVLTPFGLGNEYSEHPGSELLLQAFGGVASVTGHANGPPVRAGVPLAACMTALIASGAVQAALYRSRRKGHGAWIDVAEYDSMIMMLGNFLPGFFTTGAIPRRVGNVQPLSAPWNSYKTKDGQIVIIAISENLWRRLLEAIGRPELADATEYRGNVNRVQRRSEVDEIISAWTSQRTMRDALEVLDIAGVPASDVKTIGELIHAAQLRERGIIARTRIGEFEVPTWGSIFNIKSRPPSTRSRATGSVRKGEDFGKHDIMPLRGLRVLEVGGHTAGGMSTRLLADLGAEVIKVEMPQGDMARHTAPILTDGSAYLWHFWNVGKKSIVLNLGEREGHDTLMKLVAESDVFLQNMALDTIEKLKLTQDDIGVANPQLIYCSVSGFGMEGPDRYRRAFDTVIQAQAGIMSVTGEEGGEMVKTGPSIVDNAAALAAVVAVLAALIQRDRTGQGVAIDLALFDTAAWFTAEWWPIVWTGGDSWVVGNGHPYHPLYGSFVCADERSVAITATNGEEIEAAKTLFELPADSITWGQEIERKASSISSQALLKLCFDGHVPAKPVMNLSEVTGHWLTATRRMLLKIPISDKDECFVIGSPYKFLGEEEMVAPWRRAPRLGQHTDELLGDVLELDDSVRAELRRSGITTPSGGTR